MKQMSDNKNRTEENTGQISKRKTIIISLLILIAGIVVIFLIFITEPTAKRQGATKETAMLVEVVEVEQGDFPPLISVTGTVIPTQDIILSARVGGEVTLLTQSFTPGGFAKKGELLLQIDPSDYRNDLLLRQSELHQAQADLAIEMGRQDVAQQDYELINENLAGENQALVLREPQLNAVKARIEAAEAAVKQAELNLQRTNIRAPFDAHIINRNVNTGSQVAPGDNLGRLVGVAEYWIEATVPLSHLRWLDFPDAPDKKGSAVQIRNRTAWEKAKYRTGHVDQLIGTLEDQTRMARVLVTVEDPLAIKTESAGLPELMIGSFVEANILADTIDNVFRLSRDFVRKAETVWVMEKDTLNIKKVEIIFRDAKHAYIGSGLNHGDKVVTTNLSTVVQGAPLRTSESDSLLPSSTENTDKGGTDE